MQTFHRSANSLAKISIAVVVISLGALGWLGLETFRSPYVTHQGEIHEQPVVFSHEHHVAGLGLDCRYCHTSVERSSFAGLPPSSTCMNCHRQIWTNADLLAPVRESYATNTPLRWNRVHDLPDFVYFNHSIHIAKGMGCATCHGEVDTMPLMYEHEPLTMEWCAGPAAAGKRSRAAPQAPGRSRESNIHRSPLWTQASGLRETWPP